MNKVLNTKYGTARLYNGYFIITDGENKNKYLHRLIFEDFYGFEIPDNYVVHHKDGNKLNNCILNLQLLNNKQHNSLHMKGENNPNYNKNLSEETKQKMSEANSGGNNPFYGKTHSVESKIKMSESHTKKHARIIKRGKSKEGKQVYCINKDGKTIKRSIYPSKLLEWFTANYPKEILQIKIKL